MVERYGAIYGSTKEWLQWMEAKMAADKALLKRLLAKQRKIATASDIGD